MFSDWWILAIAGVAALVIVWVAVELGRDC